MFSFFRKKQTGGISSRLAERLKPLDSVIQQRRFRSDVPYFFPKDLSEQDRLNFQHYALRFLLKGNYVAPLPEMVRDILDVGTGTGIWVREMAKEFPEAKVVGMDIEIPATARMGAPRNSQFVEGNVLKGLPFQDGAFDFVHQRLLVAAIPGSAWPAVVAELARVTRPGGYVELLETLDVFENEGPNTARLMEWWREAGRRSGFGSPPIQELDQLFESAGLTNVTFTAVPVPLGKWGGRVGEMMGRDIHLVFNNLRVACDRLGVVPEKEYDATWKALPQEWEELHTSSIFFLVYGQKP
ncbi:ubiquinone/menaquinone biosynthesis C-methylase UbiE [Thermosporothrix hazakensis]|jgi:ubiquinone/menaquinone biosynthesis C-methylase UbiE|uniref:Ubiquinone/menaquinone biosynthesis C-methylase UbiE n=1 Tax=Thermosporothrix hazakensis TaxID=644383 RepID=A0A326UMV5_THEHA|nr:class I SAM-dependent methyltransferase [Thermosporothrix hazakensis]PZW31205.1 ubiquinone/menaquinone biosynthesis C-methylase UbiE [Thermosporothrix hazakensis]GCE50885.1 hypothetical protein KTH_57540 [Thermosporothrix hazakensis]